MIFSIILSLSMGWAIAADEKLTCESGMLRLNFGGKVTKEKSVYCFNKDKNELYSKGFELKKLKKIKLQETGSVNPGFELCTALKGEPQFVEFMADGEWFKLDRCLFSDGSYIDTGLLYSRTR